MYCRVFSSVPHLYLLDANSTLTLPNAPVTTIKRVPRYGMEMGMEMGTAKLPLIKSHCFRAKGNGNPEGEALSMLHHSYHV